ncbi:MAG: isoaspartyl peptidase/L-asparaginase [Chloroflexota bacterium]|nr:isoaspartyl peptidase/L-asparaginase [Chloroflexota bacterium]
MTRVSAANGGAGRATLPVMAASENGRAGMVAAMALLRKGGRALDAVELACRVTEDDPNDHSVGYSGLPNVMGEVELDASIMDGRDLRSGAVAAVRGYGNPITLARQVMEQLPHVLLAGRGAERFAAANGHAPQDQRTEEALQRWRERFAHYGLDSEGDADLRELTNTLTRPLNLSEAPLSAGSERRFGTVNFLALDQYGDLASAVSTSGLGWKYPSRVGDSPIIGAGNYCDNRYGATACTGMGELALRVSTARSLVLYMKLGMSLHEAGLEALRDLAYLGGVPGRYMNMVAMTPQGECAGFTTVPGKKYLYMNEEMEEPALAERVRLEESA